MVDPNQIEDEAQSWFKQKVPAYRWVFLAFLIVGYILGKLF